MYKNPHSSVFTTAKVEGNIILHQQATGSIKQGTSTASNKTMKGLFFLARQRLYDKV